MPRLKAARVVLLIVIVALILYFVKGWFIAAMVNWQPVYRASVVDQLEKQAGKQTLDSLVNKTLLLQEAKKRKVIVTKKEVDEEMKKLEDNIKGQGGNLDQLLQFQGTTRAQLREQVYLQKLLEKMFVKDATVTNEDIDAFLNTNKNAFPQGTESASVREQAKQQILQKKLTEKVQALLQKLKANAKIFYFVKY